MDLRRLFTTQSLWGKLICAFFGFLMAGAGGALLGVLIGNLFDRGLSQFFASSFWYYRSEKNRDIQRIFLTSLFAVMGHIAKADGQVSKRSIQMAKTCIKEMRLSAQEERTAQMFFKIGKNNQFNLMIILSQLYAAIYDHPNLLKLFIDTQYKISEIDGASTNKQLLLNAILRSFNRAPLYEQYQFKDDYIHTRNQEHAQSSSHYSYQSSSSYHSTIHPLADAFLILGIEPTANKQEVKRAYRRLMSRHHPDKLMAQGASEKIIQAANAKTQKIRKAYEHICARNGW